MTTRRKCSCYGTRPQRRCEVLAWDYDSHNKPVCLFCGLRLRVWHIPARR